MDDNYVDMAARLSSQAPFSERCRLKCKGTGRAAWESPAFFADVKGKPGERVLICSCCDAMLELALVDPEAPNIQPDIDQSKRRRFACPNCGYDVVLLPELKAKA